MRAAVARDVYSRLYIIALCSDPCRASLFLPLFVITRLDSAQRDCLRTTDLLRRYNDDANDSDAYITMNDGEWFGKDANGAIEFGKGERLEQCQDPKKRGNKETA